jgi:UDP-glucose 4-epimerase
MAAPTDKIFTNKNVLITGGLGFIGSNLARKLVGYGAKITLVDSLIPEYGGNIFNIADIKHQVTVNICDVRDPAFTANLLAGQDYLFNLAGQTSHLDSMSDPKTDLEINVTAQLSILEACRKSNPDVKIIFASTRQIYGRADYLPVDEAHPVHPVDVNGINKMAGEQYHLLYNNIYGIRACALRLTNTYGPGMRIKDARQTFLGIWMRLLLENRPIKVFGDGLQLRDFNYIDDCVDALLMAATSEKANGKVYNLGGTEVVELKSLAKMMIELSHGGTFELIPFPAQLRAIDIGNYYADFSLITKELGWVPKIDLKSGLKMTAAYFQSNLENYL